MSKVGICQLESLEPELPSTEGDCCCVCRFRVRAAISNIPGDLARASFHPRRFACLNPDGKCIIVFNSKDRGHGRCEMFEHRKVSV